MSHVCLAQTNFYFKNNADRYVMSFKMVNNLMIIPVYVNGKKLSFLLDTGVSSTVILNVKVTDSLKLRNAEKIRIQGLGDGDYVDAIKSTHNYIQIGDNIVSRKHKIYLILGKGFNLSNRMGQEINGIIGGDLFRDFIIKINYTTKRITFYNPRRYKYKPCRKCQTLPLVFLYQKPYLFANTTMPDATVITTKLLIDSGGSDALWLFENKHADVKVPKKFFIDYLGQGLNGNIYGKRSRILSLNLGKFKLKDITVAFPDTTSLSSSMLHQSRHGTIGAGTLKRFHLIIDYPNKKITLKKNRKYFYEAFNYNMSGIEIAYNGQMLVKEKKIQGFSNSASLMASEDKGVTIEYEYNYVFSFKPSVQITDVRKDSPAERAGIMAGDYIMEVNGKPVYTYKLQEIMAFFYEKEGKEVKLLIDRNDTRILYHFRLKKIL
ncbi:MAG: aspartyl protease family protein [Flavobacteriaceae bacterium]|nr:aspartyl protease family protein [Flavobacteriaceae bacterium]